MARKKDRQERAQENYGITACYTGHAYRAVESGSENEPMRYKSRNRFKVGDEVYIPMIGEYQRVVSDLYAPEVYGVEDSNGDVYWFDVRELQSVDESLNPE
jgi:hypothetical protein